MPITDPRLRLSEYTPNWKDRRVRNRVRYVLNFIRPMYEGEQESEVMAKNIRKVFGNHHDKNTLAAWMYSNLLRQTLWYRPGGEAYSYSVKKEGFDKISRLLEEAENALAHPGPTKNDVCIPNLVHPGLG